VREEESSPRKPLWQLFEFKPEYAENTSLQDGLVFKKMVQGPIGFSAFDCPACASRAVFLASASIFGIKANVEKMTHF
jgi:hypothetical protein